MIALGFDKIDAFVEKLQRKGINVRWDGWNIVFFKPSRGALRDPMAVRNGTEWGFEKVVSPDEQGKWLLSYGLTRGTNG